MHSFLMLKREINNEQRSPNVSSEKWSGVAANIVESRQAGRLRSSMSGIRSANPALVGFEGMDRRKRLAQPHNFDPLLFGLQSWNTVCVAVTQSYTASME